MRPLLAAATLAAVLVGGFIYGPLSHLTVRGPGGGGAGGTGVFLGSNPGGAGAVGRIWFYAYGDRPAFFTMM